MSRYRRTILGTCCIPWNEDNTLPEDIFRDSIRHLIDQGLSDLYIFGTAGEGNAVSDKQFDQITQVFAEEMKARQADPMVGIISLSLPTMIERFERAADMGVRAFQISLPSWGALSDAELFIFFREICARFPQYQFLHYNLLRARRYVTADEYSLLSAEHPNLVATKHGTSDLAVVTALMEKASRLRHFFTEASFGEGSLLGECGYLISIAASSPRRAREYFDAGVQKDVEKLVTMQRELKGMTEELMAAVGNEAHMDGAYDKIFSKIHDPRFPLRLLRPYQGASDAAFERYRTALRRKFPEWIETPRTRRSRSTPVRKS
jgi:dihydrodipicolinate synthase/N-acetylneuraminate lyase